MNRWIEILKNDDFIGAKKYIASGADTNASNDSGESVLAGALRYRCDFELVKLLIENGADIFDFDEEGVTIFDMAVTYDNLDMVRYMLETGYDVNSTKRRSRFSPLMAAVCYGRVEMARFLLENGADATATDSKGIGVRDFAQKMHKKTMLKLLDEFITD